MPDNSKPKNEQQHPDGQGRPPDDGPVVVFKDVSLHFEEKEILRNISFEVAPGETLLVLGPAGTGKSVLMKLVDGLLKPDSGSISVFGEDITGMPEEQLFKLRERIGMVFQESALFDSMNVEDNIAYRLNTGGMEHEESHKKVDEILKFVELPKAAEKFPSELSGGMRRRVSIARAIVTNPDLILYDSPTGGLDPITSTTIIELVVKQRDVAHTTSLLVTHRLQDAFTLATSRWNTDENKMEPIPDHGIDQSTHFLVLNEGSIVYQGDTHGLVHSDDPWIKQYLS